MFLKKYSISKKYVWNNKIVQFLTGEIKFWLFCFFKFLYSFLVLLLPITSLYDFTILLLWVWMVEGYWYGIVLNLDLEKVDELLLKMHLHCFIYMNVSKILPPFCLYSSSLIRRKSSLSYSLTMIQLRSEKSIDWNTLCSWRIHSTNIKFKQTKLK